MSDSLFDDAPPAAPPRRDVLTISQLNAQARILLERELKRLSLVKRVELAGIHGGVMKEDF